MYCSKAFHAPDSSGKLRDWVIIFFLKRQSDQRKLLLYH